MPPTVRIDALYCSEAHRIAHQVAKMSEGHRARREAADLENPRYCANPDRAAPLPRRWAAGVWRVLPCSQNSATETLEFRIPEVYEGDGARAA
jgi:hypothetical protein